MNWLDRSAMTLSGLCLVHCLGGTLLLALLSSAGGLVFSHRVHEIGLMFAAPLAIFALGRGACAHGRWGVAAIGLAGLSAMAGALFEEHGQPGEVALTMAGVAMLALAHYLNIRARAA